jgi:hypothetical protein
MAKAKRPVQRAHKSMNVKDRSVTIISSRSKQPC